MYPQPPVGQSPPESLQTMQVPFIFQPAQIYSPFACQVNNSFNFLPYQGLPYQCFSSHNSYNYQPFEVKFLTGHIKICVGCRQRYNHCRDGKSLTPPNDLCLVCKEQHCYYNVVNNRQQLSSLSNVHYH